MNVLLANIDPSLINIIMTQLINFKVQIVIAESDKEMINILNSKDITCLFFDIDIVDIDVFQILNILKENPKLKELKIVLLTANNSQSLMDELLSYDITGIVNKNTDYTHFLESLKKVLLYLELETNKREVVWLKPLLKDKLRISFIPEGGLERSVSKIMMICSEGVVIKIDNIDIIKNYKKRDVIRNVVFFINKKLFYTDFEIKKIEDNILTLYFSNKKELFLLEVASYIFKLMNDH